MPSSGAADPLGQADPERLRPAEPSIAGEPRHNDSGLLIDRDSTDLEATPSRDCTHARSNTSSSQNMRISTNIARHPSLPARTENLTEPADQKVLAESSQIFSTERLQIFSAVCSAECEAFGKPHPAV